VCYGAFALSCAFIDPICRVAGNNEWQLVVNFDREVITLFKETRNLQWLGFRVPINIQYFASDGQALYPYSVSLQEAVTTYTQTLKKVVYLAFVVYITEYIVSLWRWAPASD
jgi:ABC-type ATPase with predicted acetyltransferase domain